MREKVLSKWFCSGSLFHVDVFSLQESVFVTLLYLIIADAVPAAGLSRQSLQILDPKLQKKKPEASDECSLLTFLKTTDCADDEAVTALYLYIDPVLEAALGL